MRTSLKLAAAGTIAVVLAYAQAETQGVGGGQGPAAAAILDRYIEVTGGSAAYRKINVSVLEITTTGPDRSNLHTTVFQSRDGREQEESELNGHVQSKGVANSGVAW